MYIKRILIMLAIVCFLVDCLTVFSYPYLALAGFTFVAAAAMAKMYESEQELFEDKYPRNPAL